MELFLLYLWLKIDNIISALGDMVVMSTVALLVTLGISAMIKAESYDDDPAFQAADKFQKNFVKWLSIPVICFTLSTLLPTKSDIAVLVGGSYALDVAKSPEAAKLMTVIRGKANEILDEQIKKLDEKK